MKASNYVIYTHVPETDEYFLVHGYSGAIDQVSPQVMQFMLDHADSTHTWYTKDMDVVRESLRDRELEPISPESVDMLIFSRRNSRNSDYHKPVVGCVGSQLHQTGVSYSKLS